MSLFDTDGLLPGLLPASWRGRRFWIVNAEHAVGRRIHRVLFPGLDLKTFDDTGAIDEPIRVSGLIIGDDYIQQADALDAAFRAPGPATFVHPWRGPIRCILARPARISFDVAELRVARIEAEFDPCGELSAALVSPVALAAVLSGLTAAAAGLARLVLAASPMAVGSHDRAVATISTSIRVTATSAARATRSSQLMPAIVAAEGAVAAALALTSQPEQVAALAAIPTDLSAALSQVYRSRPASGIGAGPMAVPEPMADPRAGSLLLLIVSSDIGRRLHPTASAPQPGLPPLTGADLPTGLAEQSLLLAAEAAALAEAASLAVQIRFTSRQDARGHAALLDAALVLAQADAADLAGSQAAPAATLWRALGETRARLAIELNEVIGRLPEVRQIVPPGNASALLLAQHLVGDDPAAVIAYATDIVRRNRLSHPAALGAGPIEVLA